MCVMSVQRVRLWLAGRLAGWTPGAGVLLPLTAEHVWLGQALYTNGLYIAGR